MFDEGRPSYACPPPCRLSQLLDVFSRRPRRPSRVEVRLRVGPCSHPPSRGARVRPSCCRRWRRRQVLVWWPSVLGVPPPRRGALGNRGVPRPVPVRPKIGARVGPWNPSDPPRRRAGVCPSNFRCWLGHYSALMRLLKSPLRRLVARSMNRLCSTNHPPTAAFSFSKASNVGSARYSSRLASNSAMLVSR